MWEMIKLKIREQSLKYSTVKKAKISQYDEELVKEINSLQRLAESRAPGTDGLPAEFYKVFWNDISDLFLNSINYAYRSSQLSETQRRGIIKLIPKKDTEPNLIKNWRPISLINCDYKIAAKAIADRFKQVIPIIIINYDQTGFLKGRFIGENIRLIDVLGLKPHKNKKLNFLFLVTRYFVWICTMGNISPEIKKTSPSSSHIIMHKSLL